jgi:hypothetical protein
MDFVRCGPQLTKLPAPTREINLLSAAGEPHSVLIVAAFNAIFISGPGRSCTYAIRMRRGSGALTGPGANAR